MSESRSHPLAWIEGELAALESADLLRTRAAHAGPQTAVVTMQGRTLVNFASNDYLGLAADPRLARAAAEAAREAGWGAGASPLISGYTTWHERLEARLAEFEQTEAALLFTSGFAANVGTICALAGRGDAVFSDELNHASLIDGCRLSRAKVFVYPHGDAGRLEELLASAGGFRRRLIVTDSLFSMEGDLAPVMHLAASAERYDALLLIDEAHATGVFGRDGRGVAEHFDVPSQRLVRVGTLSKALGCSGGFVAGSRVLIDWLLNRVRPYVFSTASPPANAAAALAALDILRDEPHRRAELLSRATALRQKLRDRGWNIGNSESQIIPLVVGEPKAAMELSLQLREGGYFVPAIRPPSVPAGRSLLRLSLSWGHTPEMIEGLIETLPAAAGDLIPS